MWLCCLVFAAAACSTFTASFCFWSRCFAFSDLSPMRQSSGMAGHCACRELNRLPAPPRRAPSQRSGGRRPVGVGRRGAAARVAALKRTDGALAMRLTLASARLRRLNGVDDMDTHTVIFAVLIVLLLGGGGFYFTRRRV
jgi:LPXTG-motif cell wall-anchored protein